MVTVALLTTDDALRREWRGLLAEWGYRPWLLDPELTVLEQLRDRGADVVLIDFARFSDSLGAIVRQLKREAELRHVPVLALCTSDELPRVDFSSGLEDFIIREAPEPVLIARLKLALWRHSKVDNKDTIRAGKVAMNLASYTVSVDGGPLELTFKEYELLRFLMTHRGRVFSRDALLRHVWGEDYFGGTRTVDVHIRRLRSKVGPEFESLIQTVRNVGYRFKADSS